MTSQISKKLMLGIFLLPVVFAWFTLRKGVGKTTRIIAFTWMVLLVAAVAGQGPDGFSAQSNTTNTSVATAPPVASYEKTAYKLYSEYDRNKVQAASLYKGKYVKITGRIGKIGKDITQAPYITLETSRDAIGPRYKIQAIFKDPNMVINVSPGQTVSIICKVGGKVGNLICRDAQLSG